MTGGAGQGEQSGEAAGRTGGEPRREPRATHCLQALQVMYATACLGIDNNGWPLPGMPSLYVDRASIDETTRDATTGEELRGTGALTQFGRAMKVLKVKVIMAHSPQAKGRVERRHGVFQDRLVKALRLQKISSLEKANEMLEQSFLPMLARRFTVPALREADIHRRAGRKLNLDRVLSFQEERVVQNDWTVRWRNRWFQLTEANQKLSLARARIVVIERLDGGIELVFRGRTLEWVELPGRPKAAVQTQKKTRKGTSGGQWRPGKHHPWRKRFKRPEG